MTDGRTAICPGTYDPVTNGHLDIIGRAANVFDRVVVGVVNQPTRKETTLFTAEERRAFIDDAVSRNGLGNVEVEVFSPLELGEVVVRTGEAANGGPNGASPESNVEEIALVLCRRVRSEVLHFGDAIRLVLHIGTAYGGRRSHSHLASVAFKFKEPGRWRGRLLGKQEQEFRYSGDEETSHGEVLP